MLVLYDNAFHAPQHLIDRSIADRQHLNRMEFEDYLRRQVNDYQNRKERYWHPDFSSLDAYLASVEPNRERWREALGVFTPPDADLAPESSPCFEDDDIVGRWVEVRLDDGLTARAVFAHPKNPSGPLPLVITHHGLVCSPEHVLGLVPSADYYWSFAQRLVRDGYAILAPLQTTDGGYRSRLDRLCRLLGFTLEGLEVAKISRLLDWATIQPMVNPDRIAMWGLSMGGLFTTLTVPVELRIKVGIIAAFFNHRANKLAVEDPRYSCYLPLSEEYIFIPGWLREFSDAELMALDCPRPMQVQCGKADAVLWWPMVVEEFERARAYYGSNGIADRCELCLHHGGHEIVYDSGLDFLRRWL